jgi:hypothetical protein
VDERAAPQAEPSERALQIGFKIELIRHKTKSRREGVMAKMPVNTGLGFYVANPFHPWL